MSVLRRNRNDRSGSKPALWHYGRALPQRLSKRTFLGATAEVLSCHKSGLL
jgi:hypothetical protein